MKNSLNAEEASQVMAKCQRPSLQVDITLGVEVRLIGHRRAKQSSDRRWRGLARRSVPEKKTDAAILRGSVSTNLLNVGILFYVQLSNDLTGIEFAIVAIICTVIQ